MHNLLAHVQVHATLKFLGVNGAQIKTGSTNTAFEAIALWIGSPACSSKPFGEIYNSISQGDECRELAAKFDVKHAAYFWGNVMRKTFVERRTWWAVYRAYHRVFQLNLTAFHIMMAQVMSAF